MKILLLSAVMVGVAFTPSLSMADTHIIDEAQVLRAAMQVSPDFQSVLRDYAGEQADATQEILPANPTVDIGAARSSSRGNDVMEYELEVEQPLKLSQLTGVRAMLSNALFERADLRRQYGMLQAYWNTRQLYAQAWQYQEQARLYADFKKRAQDTAHKINQSVKAGQTPISEGSLFAGDAAKFGSDLERVEAQKAQILLQLERATGLNLAGTTLEKPVLNTVQTDVVFLEDQARQNASLVRLLEADVKAAERQKRAALADSGLPEIAPRFIYARSPDNKEDTVGVGVVLTVPLWDRNQSERRKADAARVFAQRQLDTLQSLPLGERLTRTLEAVERLDRRIVSLEKDALPNYRKGFDQAQRSFNAGQTDAASLWQVRERLFETEQDILGARLDAIEARRLLSLETGMMPQEVTP